jgi:hypothetical protein
MGTGTVTYLLDNNVVQYFLHGGCGPDLATASRHVQIAVAREVHHEACVGHHAAAGREALSGDSVKILDIVIGSPEDQSLNALAPPTTARGHDERESIALALHDPSLVFVANDKNAMWLALQELHAPGERIIGVPVFLRRLHEANALSPTTIDQVMWHWKGRRPTWWADWRSGIEPAAT